MEKELERLDNKDSFMDFVKQELEKKENNVQFNMNKLFELKTKEEKKNGYKRTSNKYGCFKR